MKNMPNKKRKKKKEKLRLLIPEVNNVIAVKINGGVNNSVP